jgi:hypothetical protein
VSYTLDRELTPLYLFHARRINLRPFMIPE